MVADVKVAAELVAVITAVHDETPLVLTTAHGQRLPSGPLQSGHRSMQAGMREWVTQQTGYDLGYIEQLYTFADRGRGPDPILEVSYLGLTTVAAVEGRWRNWFDYFPWEDRREGDTDAMAELVPALERWARAGESDTARRRLRCAVTFGLEGHPWLPEMALQRYELLYEAGLVPEAPGGPASGAQARPGADVDPHDGHNQFAITGVPMERHHRRILATGLARLRAKIQYRPVVFELVPETFTLGQLQATVEAVAGQPLHKQNFRRLVAQQQLVEETGELDPSTGGRPAKLFRFRREVLEEREVAGTKLPITRSH